MYRVCVCVEMGEGVWVEKGSVWRRRGYIGGETGWEKRMRMVFVVAGSGAGFHGSPTGATGGDHSQPG